MIMNFRESSYSVLRNHNIREVEWPGRDYVLISIHVTRPHKSQDTLHASFDARDGAGAHAVIGREYVI